MTTPIYDHLKGTSKFPVSPEKEKCIVETVDELLNPPSDLDSVEWPEEGGFITGEDYLYNDNPSDLSNSKQRDDNNLHRGNKFSPIKLLDRPGLLLGKVQCGKTDTFEKIIGLAFDKGINIAIILTKGTNALVSQTISRFEKDFHDFEPGNSNNLPYIYIKDILQNKKGFESIRGRLTRGNNKLIIVVKKEINNLKHLINVFKKSTDEWLINKNVLIVDDEADFASRGYRKGDLNSEQAKLAEIAAKIDEFRLIPDFSRYLQVTATPYSLFLQPDGCINIEGGFALPFRPKFTKLVPIHDKYIGGYQYFVEKLDPESPFNNLFYPVSETCINVLGRRDRRYLNNGISSKNILGLTTALLAYLLATGIRRIQEAENGNCNYSSSAVFHVTIANNQHQWQYELIKVIIKQLGDYFSNPHPKDARLDFLVGQIYEDLSESITKANTKGKENLSGGYTTTNTRIPSLNEVKKEIADLYKYKDINVVIVNSENDVKSLLDSNTGQLRLDATMNIFIGGNILDRGITINNLLCFFYGRDPKTFQQDTVLQHARYYGARDLEDMAVTRLHTTDEIYQVLLKINDLDEQLRNWFKKGLDKTSSVKFIGYDDDIKPTSPQKTLPSKTIGITKQKLFVPKGMWIRSQSSIGKIILNLDSKIQNYPGYVKDDFFEMDAKTAMEILRDIERTYVYADKHGNISEKNDMPELMSAFHYCSEESNGKVWVLHRTNRNLNRIRENGGWGDAPADGRTDLTPSRAKAIDRPVLMLIRENGNETKRQVGIDSNNNPIIKNIGWNNTPFYWPVLMSQSSIQEVLFTADQKTLRRRTHGILDQLKNGIDPSDILEISVNPVFLENIGQVGTKYYSIGETNTIKIGVTNSTALRFFIKDKLGNYVKAVNTTLNPNQSAVAYTYNDGIFPFKLIPYKYLLLKVGKDVGALVKLMPNSSWNVFPKKDIQNGWLYDSFTNKRLIVVSDKIIGADKSEKDFESPNLCQWIIEYPVEEVLRKLP